ncbi:DinB family protein [Terrimonas sp. NA20]|uniref:DinB family protein n=1 Tax=Terrimonas ginsenosidimutans TaxID=2908004 RepID=A0ABS9KQW8_9BACT|nr:DinB family protein [Terrimonas ginsenosidimutans]MCG2614709.1 DinB family protein [Terrimonas ginsenosidimutans]
MKLFNSNTLIDQLQANTRQLIATATFLKNEDPGVLLQQPGPGKWSVIQVLEHLNSYSDYYLPALQTGLSKNAPATLDFKSGWLGNYFTNSMLPKEGEVRNKMKAPKNHRPSFHADAKPVIEKFLQQQHQLLGLLEIARQKNIGKIRIPISLAKFIKLKAGDTFRFLIAHEQRHFVQIRNTIEAVTGVDKSQHLNWSA